MFLPFLCFEEATRLLAQVDLKVSLRNVSEDEHRAFCS